MEARSRRILLWGGALEAGLGIVGALAALLTGIDLSASIAFDLSSVAVGLAASVPMLVLFYAALRSRLRPLVRIRRTLSRIILPHFRGVRRWELLLLAVLAGVGEELLFRGFLQSLFSSLLGTGLSATGWSILLASVVFGLLHWITAAYAGFAAVLGAYLGVLFVVTGNLVVPAVCHAAYDFVALSAYLRRDATPPY